MHVDGLEVYGIEDGFPGTHPEPHASRRAGTILDVLCNREIKFDSFASEAKKLGGEFIATGHYCRKEIISVNNTLIYRLLAGRDEKKDQSYFLCQVSQEQLASSLFPIGNMTKPEVRRLADDLGLATAHRKDSQGICFVGKVHLPTFLQQKLEARKGRHHRNC